MRRFKKMFRKRVEQNPYRSLNIGLIKEYSMIIPRTELKAWTSMGWLEDKSFRDFNYYPNKGQSLILGKPAAILDIDLDTLIGSKIINFCDCLGTYGMGGPGFFGLLIERENVKEYLTYAVWASSEYIAMDNRVLGCHINYNASHRPWKSQWQGESEENQWDEVSEILNGSTIIGVDLTDSQLTIEILSKEAKHILNFYKYNKELPPHGNGEARKQAFNEGNLGSYIVFCNEDAVLHV